MAFSLPQTRSSGERLAAALLLSLVAHAAFVLLRRVGTPPARPEITAVTTPTVDEGLVDVESAPVLDDVGAGREERAQGEAPAAPPPPAPAPAAPPPPATPPPPPSPATPATPDAPPVEAAPVPPLPASPTAAPRPATTGSTPTPPPAGSGSAEANAPPGDGGGFAQKRAPDAAARFARELAAYAAPVPGWREVPLGSLDPIVVHVALDDEGRVLPEHDPIADPRGAAPPLAESVRRTVRALRTPLALPGAPFARRGTLALRIETTVSQVEVEDLPGGEYRLASRFAEGRGEASFVLESGRAVRFALSLAEEGGSARLPP